MLVSSFSTGGTEAGGILPTDQFSLNFAKIEYEYTERKSDGSFGTPIKVGWDVKMNKSSRGLHKPLRGLASFPCPTDASAASSNGGALRRDDRDN